MHGRVTMIVIIIYAAIAAAALAEQKVSQCGDRHVALINETERMDQRGVTRTRAVDNVRQQRL